MDLVSLIVGLPVSPLRGIVALAQLLRDEAGRELYDPSRLRAQVEEIEAQVKSGRFSRAEGEKQQEELLERLTVVPSETMETPTAGPEGGDEGDGQRR